MPLTLEINFFINYVNPFWYILYKSIKKFTSMIFKIFLLLLLCHHDHNHHHNFLVSIVFFVNATRSSCFLPSDSFYHLFTCEQPGVNAPGTPKMICFPLLNNSVVTNFSPGLCSNNVELGSLSPTYNK